VSGLLPPDTSPFSSNRGGPGTLWDEHPDAGNLSGRRSGRASQVLQELLGVQLSAGSIATFVTTCHQQLAEVETDLKAALVKANVIHQDETGARVGKTGWWVHVCSTDRLTHYAAHPSRGRKALDAIGIAPQFRGTSVHDALQSYQSYSFTQAWCNVHHLRKLTFVEEELKQPWARKMKDLLLDMKAEVERAKALGQHELDILVLARLLRRYDELLAEGDLANPPPPPPKKSEQGKRKPGRAKQSPARNLLDRLVFRQVGRAAVPARFCRPI
jgi:transposase